MKSAHDRAEIDGNPRPSAWHRLAVCVSLGLIAASAAALVYAWSPSTYTSRAVLRVIPPRPTAWVEGAAEAAESLDQFLDTQVKLATTSKILGDVLSDPKVKLIPQFRADDPEDELRRSISVSVVPRTTLIAIEARSTSSRDAATVANAVTDAFLTAESEHEVDVHREEMKGLEYYRRQVADEVAQLRRRAAVVPGVATIEVDGVTRPAPGARQLERLRSELEETAIARIKDAALLEALRSRNAGDDAGRARDRAEVDAAELRLAAASAAEKTLTTRLQAATSDQPRDLDRARAAEVDLRQLEALLARVTARLERVQFVARAGNNRLTLWNRAIPSPRADRQAWATPAAATLVASALMLAATLAVSSGRSRSLLKDGEI